MRILFTLFVFSLSIVSSFSQVNISELRHYLFPEFVMGKVLMKNGTEYKTLINYNSLTEEMVYENNGKKLAIGKDAIDKIDTIFVNNRKFVSLNKTFVELVSHSTYDLFVEHKCKIKDPGKSAGYGGKSETTAITSYSSFYSGGLLYNLNLPEGYEVKPYVYYWIKKNGEFKHIENMQQLKKYYPDKKALFKSFVKEHNIKFNIPENIVQLVEFLESGKD